MCFPPGLDRRLVFGWREMRPLCQPQSRAQRGQALINNTELHFAPVASSHGHIRELVSIEPEYHVRAFFVEPFADVRYAHPAETNAVPIESFAAEGVSWPAEGIAGGLQPDLSAAEISQPIQRHHPPVR